MNISSNNSIKLETSETQAGEWNIEVNWNIDWVDSVIWINSVYFLEVLWVIKSNYIDISFESPLSPILITPVQEDKDGNPEKKDKKEIQEEFRHIIMPLKIDKI
jgi:DNA polymerase III sliding clamp (beta) subunit (PCNA family)